MMAQRRHLSEAGFLIAAVIITIGGCGDAAKPPPQKMPSESAPSTSEATVSAPMPNVVSPPEDQVAALSPTEPAMVFRPEDERPKFDDAALAVLGIQRYESKRLRLYTDLPLDAARPLPPLIDAAYDALIAYFGALPPARSGGEFQVTGYLMRDEQRFHEAGMIPESLPAIEHGRHRRNEFWMREQPFDYYRRHLLIHEMTHCFMLLLPENRPPVWYVEGMAELFGTHRTAADGTLQFNVMPTSPEEFAGFGRISIIRDLIENGRSRTIPEVLGYKAEEFLTPEPYAWSWGLCAFLDHHPRYRARFRELAQHQSPRPFAAAMEALLTEGGQDLDTEWTLFIHNLKYGYDIPAAAISFAPGTKLLSDKSVTAEIAAHRGWQSTRVQVEAQQRYEITASGQFTLAQQPKPWVSTADGISFRYVNGIPAGRLLACVREEARSDNNPESMLGVVSVGSRGVFLAPETGTLYLRLNDSWSELADNTGTVTVSVRPVVD